MHIIPGYCINLYIFVSRAFMTDVYCNLSHCNTFYCNTGWICKCTDQCLYVYPAFKTISPTFKAVFLFQDCLVLQSHFGQIEAHQQIFWGGHFVVVKNFEYNLCFVIIVMAKCLFPASVKF